MAARYGLLNTSLRRVTGWCALWLALLLPFATLAAAQDDPRAVFDSLYGSRLQQVQRTGTTDDDFALAKELLEAAHRSTQTPGLLQILCEEAYNLAARDRDSDVADQAMQLLAQHLPEKRAYALLQRANFYHSRFTSARGADRTNMGQRTVELLLELADITASETFSLEQSLDAASTEDAGSETAHLRRAMSVAAAIRSPYTDQIKARLDQAGQRERAARQAQSLMRRLESDSSNRALQAELLRTLIVDLDNPAHAARYASTADEPWRTNVQLAAASPETLSAAQCERLADWYVSLADQAAATVRAPLLHRARTYYEQLLADPAASDLVRQKARLALTTLDTRIRELAGGAAWFDLLRLIKVDKHVVRGEWAMQRNVLRASQRRGQAGLIAVPATTQGSYLAEVRFTRRGGEERFLIVLPVGESQVAAYVNLHGYSGLGWIGGKSLQDGPAKISESLITTGREHTLQADVTVDNGNAQIELTFDGRRIVSWRGRVSALSIHDDYRTPNAPAFALALRGEYDITSLRVRMKDGQLKLLD